MEGTDQLDFLANGWQVGEHVHRGDPRDTSSEAALLTRRVVGPQMRLVFDFLRERPMTQDQLRAQTGLGDNAAKRCSDLKNCGWIRDSGARWPSFKGNSAVLWEVTEFGLGQAGLSPAAKPGLKITLVLPPEGDDWKASARAAPAGNELA